MSFRGSAIWDIAKHYKSEEPQMRPMRIFVLMAAVILVAPADGGDARKRAESRLEAGVPQAAQALTVAATMDQEISNVEREVVDAAEAMPE
jgi:hypothetical protein